MKFQRSTLILMFLALSTTGLVYVFEIRGKEQQQAIEAKQQQIFAFNRDDVQSFTVTTPNQTVTIERAKTKEEIEKSPWKIVSPIQSPANQVAVDSLLTEFVKNQSLPSDPNSGVRKLTIDPNKLPDYGLDQTGIKVDITLKDQKTHQIVFGQSDFSGQSIYIQADPNQNKSDKATVLVVPQSVLAAASNSLDQWKIDPTLLNTPTPSPSPSPSPSPASKDTRE